MQWLSKTLDQFFAFLPDLVGGLVVLGVGILIAWVLSRATRPLLHRLGFDRLLANNEVIADPSLQSGSRAGATAVYWTVVVVALLQAARIWRLELVANGLARVVAFIPNLLAAAFIVMAAYMLANFVRRRVAGRAAGEARGTSNLLASGVHAGILTIGAFLALRELRIGDEILVIAFAFTFGAIALAVALSFGLGARSVAGRVAQDWYERRGASRDRVVVERPTGTSEPPVRERQPRDELRGPH